MLPLDTSASRIRTYLESFNLQDITLIALYLELDPECGNEAYVADPRGYIHLVKKGFYMGTNYGQIVEISQKGIKLIELKRNREGLWEETEI